MKTTPLFLWLMCTCFLLSHGMQIIGMGHTRNCLCPKYESRVIPPQSLRSIKILPRGPHCKITEVIAGLASGERVCLDHSASWVKKLVNFILGKQRSKG